MTRRLIVPLLALVAFGCKRPAPAHRMGTSVNIAPTGVFQVIPATMDPNASNLPGAVGTIVQNAGGANAWAKKADGTWQAFPGAAATDGGVSSSGNLLQAVCVDAISNITLSGVQTIDGQSAGTGTCLRVLAIAQTDPTTNGVYVAGAGAWTRSTDFATAGQMILGALVPVYAGTSLTTGAGSLWEFSTSSAITVGTTALTFTQGTGSGALANRTLAQARLALAPEYFIQTTGASVQTLSLTGLNGNADGDYDIFIDIKIGHVGTTYSLQTNLGGTSHFGSNYGVTGSLYIASAASWALTAGSGISGTNLVFFGTMTTRAGILRQIVLNGFNDSGAANLPQLSGYSTDTSTSLTTLTLNSSQSDGIAAGSYIQAIARGR